MTATVNAVSTTSAIVIPTVAPMKAIKLPTVAERELDNGLRVLAVRRTGIPRFEARLNIPSAQRGNDDGSKRRVLAKTLMSGTAERSSLELARELQRLGAGLDTFSDADEISVFGSALSTNLTPFLELMAEVITGAAYPNDEVSVERDRAAKEILLARSQPATIAREALLKRIYGEHAYGRGLPEPEVVEKVTPAALRSFHSKRVLPRDAVLVLVGDFRAETAIDKAADAFGAWADQGQQPGLTAPKPIPVERTLLINRPGAVQTNIRMGARAVRRSDPDHPALTLANLVFGGYFSSRLVDNIREKRGYTYTAGSAIQQHRQGAHLTVVADVGTDVTAPALLEMRYELGRIVATNAEESELRDAKRYLAGNVAIGTQTQSGLASYVASLAVSGLTIEYLRDFPRAVEKLTAAEARDAARRYFAPSRLGTVLVGDAEKIHAEVSAFDDVEVVG